MLQAGYDVVNSLPLPKGSYPAGSLHTGEELHLDSSDVETEIQCKLLATNPLLTN